MADLTVTELRDYVATALSDASLQSFLDEAYLAIEDTLGPSGPLAERLHGAGELLMLSRRATSITSVLQYQPWPSAALTLASNDYELSTSGRVLRRLGTGTNPGWHWGTVLVTYQPPDDTSRRTKAAVELVKLDLAYSGYTGESTQSESRSFDDLAAQRQAIMATFVDQDPALL
jgi:hypothetical protein